MKIQGSFDSLLMTAVACKVVSELTGSGKTQNVTEIKETIPQKYLNYAQEYYEKNLDEMSFSSNSTAGAFELSFVDWKYIARNSISMNNMANALFVVYSEQLAKNGIKVTSLSLSTNSFRTRCIYQVEWERKKVA